MRTDQEIVDQTDALARTILRSRGFDVSDDYKCSQFANPRGNLAWCDACTAQKFLTNTDPEEALQNLQQ